MTQVRGYLAKAEEFLLAANAELDEIPPSKATAAVERAKRCVEVARRVVASL